MIEFSQIQLQKMLVGQALQLASVEAAKLNAVAAVDLAEDIAAVLPVDLREFWLLPFGGAGPIQAGAIADSLKMAGLVVPLYPGVFSAIGLLMSDVKHDYIQSRLTPLLAAAPTEVDAVFRRLEGQAATELAAEDFAPSQVRIARALDMRYAGQGYEITVPVGAIGGIECTSRRIATPNFWRIRASVSDTRE